MADVVRGADAPLAPHAPPDSPRWWVGAVIAGSAAVLYAAYALLRHDDFRTAGYDLGLNYQLVQSYARFQTPHSDIVGAHVNLLGDHFSPAMALLAPAYWLWQDPRVLLLAQAVLVALSIVPVHRLARRHLGDGVALAVAIGYALGWPLQAMIGFDVHEVMLAVPLIAFALDAMDRRADRTLLLLCAGLVLVKEDMGLLVIALGIVRILLEGRPGTRTGRRTGAAAIAIGVVGYVVATMVVIPAFSARGGVTHWTYDALGPDLPSALASLTLHPLHAIQLFFWTPPVKTLTVAALLVPTLLLCVRSPLLIAALPLLAERFFSSYNALWGPYYHYSATVWPILVMAAVDGARRWRHRSPMLGRALGGALLGTAVLGTALIPMVFPLHRLLVAADGDPWHVGSALDDQRAVVAAIPPHTCVEADNLLVPHLLTRNRVSEPGHLGRAPDFVAIDLSARRTGQNSPSPQRVETLVRSRGYVLVASPGQLRLYRSPTDAGARAACRP